MVSNQPSVVLVNILTGLNELARACADDAALRIVPFSDIDEVAGELPQARILVTSTLQYDARTAQALRHQAQRLEWIFCPNTGIETFARHGIPQGVLFSHAPGRAAAQVAEHAMALLLGLGRGLAQLERSRATAVWDRPRIVGAMSSLIGRQLCLVGFGAIGREVARRARAFGMRITAIATQARTDPDADCVLGPQALDAALSQADAVILAVPQTAETFHLLDARRIALLKPSAFVVNIARGSVLDTAALAEALQADRLAGAGLDVFEQEPLPQANPLWRLANVLISPHVAGVGGPDEVLARVLIIRQLLLDFLAGQPPSNQVSVHEMSGPLAQSHLANLPAREVA